MMTSSGSHARTVMNMAAKIAPAERADWFNAMALEMAHMPDADLPGFARGCLIAAVKARITSPRFILATAHWLLVGGAAAWAVLNIWFAGRMSVAHTDFPEAIAFCTAAVFGLGAIATARYGFTATIILGTPMLLVFGAAGLIVKLLLPQSSATALHFALIVENMAVILAALLIGFVVPRLVTVKEAVRR